MLLIFFLRFGRLVRLYVRLKIRLYLMLLMSLYRVNLYLHSCVIRRTTYDGSTLIHSTIYIKGAHTARSNFLSGLLRKGSLGRLPVPVRRAGPFVSRQHKFRIKGATKGSMRHFAKVRGTKRARGKDFYTFRRGPNLVVSPERGQIRLPRVLQKQPYHLVRILLRTNTRLLRTRNFIVQGTRYFSLQRNFFQCGHARATLRFQNWPSV